jgi:hypothetical protein
MQSQSPNKQKSPLLILSPEIFSSIFKAVKKYSPLDEKLFDLDLHPVNRAFQLRRLVGCNGTCNYRPRDTARTPQSDFAAT